MNRHLLPIVLIMFFMLSGCDNTEQPNKQDNNAETARHSDDTTGKQSRQRESGFKEFTAPPPETERESMKRQDWETAAKRAQERAKKNADKTPEIVIIKSE